MKVWDTEEFKEYHAMHSDYGTVIFLATCNGSRRRAHRPVTSAIMLKAPWGMFKGDNYINGVFKGTEPADGGIKVFSQQVRTTGEVYERKALLTGTSFSVMSRTVGSLIRVHMLKCIVPGCHVEARLDAYRVSYNWDLIQPWGRLARTVLKRKAGAPIGVVKVSFSQLEETLVGHTGYHLKVLEAERQPARTR